MFTYSKHTSFISSGVETSTTSIYENQQDIYQFAKAPNDSPKLRAKCTFRTIVVVRENERSPTKWFIQEVLNVVFARR